MAVPKPRREGGRGGMNHTGSQARSARRGGNPGRYGGGPPKKGCAVIAFALVAAPAITAAAGIVYLRA